MTPSITNALADYPVIHEHKVAWGDMDALGHLNNVRYYEYAQEARINYMNQVLPEHLYTVIVSTSCQYFSEVKYPDTLKIGVRLKRIGTTSLTHQICYFSTRQNKIVAEGESVVVVMNKQTAQKFIINAPFRQALEQLEKSCTNQKAH